MALASAHAISGLSQTELYSSIYGTHFQEDPVRVLPLSTCIPSVFFLNRWVWSDISAETLLLIPGEALILDVKRAEGHFARDQDRAVRHSEMLRFSSLLRFSTYLASLSEIADTTNAFFMKGIRP